MFLSLFNLQLGFKTLLESFFEEFKKNENILLFILTRKTYSDPRNDFKKIFEKCVFLRKENK